MKPNPTAQNPTACSTHAEPLACSTNPSVANVADQPAASTTGAISVPELAQRLQSGSRVALIDVRTPAEFQQSHIAGASNIPVDTLSECKNNIPHGCEIVWICQSGGRATMARELFGNRPDHRVLTGGMSACAGTTLDIRGGAPRRWPIDRQVRLIAGGMVFAATLLGVFVNSWFLALAGAVGFGLFFAGATNTCGLAMLLERAPWNQSGATRVCAVK